MIVTDDQLFQIQGYLMSEGVTGVALQEDLADHFCCVIEEGMQERGLVFESAFEEAKQRIAPEGVEGIQEDLDYLLTIKKKIMLRKVVFVFGFIGMLSLMLALGLRVSGVVPPEVAGLVAMAGILTLAISILPYTFYQMYMRSVQRLKEA